MSDFVFAGIAIFPAGVDKYNISISLISSTAGSVVDNVSFSSLSEQTALEETIRSTFRSTIPKTTKIKAYISSVPPDFPPDRHYDVLKAMRLASFEATGRWRPYPIYPFNHAEAFTALLPQGKAISVLALDFYSPPHLHVASLLSTTEENGKRVNTVTQELSVSLAHVDSFQGILEKIKSSLDPSGTNKIPNPQQIMLIQPLMTSGGPGGVDLNAVVAELYPNIPVSIVTPTDIAQAAASFAYARSFLRRRHRLVHYCLVLPVSVATASGAAVPIAFSTFKFPISCFVVLTNSVDNQKSATVRLMLGKHAQTRNNIQRAVIILDGLTPLPRGEARIKVLIKAKDFEGWRSSISVRIEQKDGPKRKFFFPRFSANLPQDVEKYDMPEKKETDDWYAIDSVNVVGSLPV